MRTGQLVTILSGINILGALLVGCGTTVSRPAATTVRRTAADTGGPTTKNGRSVHLTDSRTMTGQGHDWSSQERSATTAKR